MIHLHEITEENWQEAIQLSVRKEQQSFLDNPVGIIARGYVYRRDKARVLAIMDENTMAGIAMVRNLDEEPACYDLQQFFIDQRFQGKGFGAEALKLLLSMLQNEQAYDDVEVCVHQNNGPALRMFQNAGFQDTGYVDPHVPDCRNLKYSFTDKNL